MPTCSNAHQATGPPALEHLRSRWERYKEKAPEAASFVEKSLEDLAAQIEQFSSEGLSACHNDICNANWLFASDGKIYIIDLDSMSLEDPAADMGALLWWYYPPRQRQEFLDIAGYRYDQDFRTRMRFRMAIHCLSIALPREQSFESFDSGRFHMFLTDFKTVLDGRENPQGYAD